jgi:predicted adenine nucleotide alpha hydrolase (AANH) superfamily ATPase
MMCREGPTVKIVLHVCCGVCAAGVVETLLSEGHEVCGLFCNPNIYPVEEYQRRLEAARTVAERMSFRLDESPYVPEEWLKEAASLAEEPEGGARCEVCFRFRLGRTHLHMLDSGADAFTTTLTVSPHKRATVVNRVGGGIGGDRFLARDFKKRDGFKRATALAKEWGIYQQSYCGCLYSMR